MFVEAMNTQQVKLDSLDKVGYKIRRKLKTPLLKLYVWPSFMYDNNHVRYIQTEFIAQLRSAGKNLSEEAFYTYCTESYPKHINMLNREIKKRYKSIKILGLKSDLNSLK